MQGLVDRVTDAVFAGREDFIIQLRKLAGDLVEQLIRAGIFRAFRVAEFLANTFLHFLVELLVLGRTDDAVADQTLTPDAQRITLLARGQLLSRAVKLLVIGARVT